jgi:hypothetical protein
MALRTSRLSADGAFGSGGYLKWFPLGKRLQLTRSEVTHIHTDTFPTVVITTALKCIEALRKSAQFNLQHLPLPSAETTLRMYRRAFVDRKPIPGDVAK